MAGLLLPVCSIFFAGLLGCVYFFKKRADIVENKMYAVMLVCSFIDSIFVSILQYLALGGVTDLEMTFVSLFNKLDFIVLILFCNSLLLYTILITFSKQKKDLKKYLKFFGFIDIIFAFLLLICKVEVISTMGNYSVSGTSITITYIICFVYIISSVLIALFNIKKVDRRHIPIFMVIFLMILLFFIFKANPYLIVISIVLTFIDYIMYFTIENPDIHMINQLNIAKEQAEKANMAKTEFLSSMSHEIRTPLNAVVGFSECMLTSEDLKETKEFAKDVVDASNNLLEIVNGILDISKIEANKMEVIPKEYNPREVFNSLSKLVLPRIKEKPIEFKMNLSPDIPGILKGDMGKLKQIVLNLLTNAAKYTDKGTIEFTVTCINRMNTNTCLLYISVTDTGRGIKKEDITKLFNKFERIDEDRNTTIEGTGLGLAITKSLTEMMGGKITVQSKYEEGSTFRIYLEQEIISMEIPEESGEEIQINYDLHKGKSILIVDDSKINLKVAAQILKPYQFNVRLVESGFEALEVLENQTFDLILMDIMMPKMNGIETLHRVKKIEGLNIPVVALTADAIEGTEDKYLNAGFDDYLSKPIDKMQLDRVLNKFLKEKEED